MIFLLFLWLCASSREWTKIWGPFLPGPDSPTPPRWHQQRCAGARAGQMAALGGWPGSGWWAAVDLEGEAWLHRHIAAPGTQLVGKEYLERPVLLLGRAWGKEGRRMQILVREKLMWTVGREKPNEKAKRQRWRDGVRDALHILRELGLVPSPPPPNPQLPLQEAEQWTLAQRRKVTHREHKTSSGGASLPSSGAVWSPKAQRENTAGHTHNNTTGRRHAPGSGRWGHHHGGRSCPAFQMSHGLTWGLGHAARVSACQELDDRDNLYYPCILQMRKLRPRGGTWLSQGHLVWWSSQDQATSFTCSSTWTIKNLQGTIYVLWGSISLPPHVIYGVVVL